MKLNDIGITVVNAEPLDDKVIGEKYIPDIWENKEKKIINENIFAKYFCEVNKVVFANGLFYTKDGKVTQDAIEKDIWAS
ncbi:MAG: hypothetical protein IIZ31_07495, partial [Lachnospiraceae bacterium]|nr:hypothetical protein [Lachnospiraceae bacterium]